MNNTGKIEINLDGIIDSVSKALSMTPRKKPKFELKELPKNFLAGVLKGGSMIYLNSLYFSCEKGKYYIDNCNGELLKMRFTHEVMHVFAYYGDNKCGICTNVNKYNFVNNFKSGYLLDYNTALDEGITQMFADEFVGKVTNRFCDGYYLFKKIAQLLKYLFGTKVMIDSYFKHSGSLEKNINNYCKGLYELINRKLTLTCYINSMMKHIDINEDYNADLKIENDICNGLSNELFNECVELIINAFVIPWIKEQKKEDIEKEIKDLLAIFDDSVTIKNRVMFYLMKGYKHRDETVSLSDTKTDVVLANIIGINNLINYNTLADGTIFNVSANTPVPYDEALYEYIYSKIITKEDWEIIDKSFKNSSLSNNTIKISINNDKTIYQRRLFMITLKQYMKKNNYIVVNDLDYLDNGTEFEVNYINEELTMDDIIFLVNNYSMACLPNDPSNVIQVIDKKTNRAVSSYSLISKCKLAFKIGLLKLSSKKYQDEWKKFTDIAKRQISETGMIKKSIEYNNNPFLTLFSDGYGCEWFYDYMRQIPVEFDRIKQDLYLSENEMNMSRLNSEEDNKRLSMIFSDYVTSNTITK